MWTVPSGCETLTHKEPYGRLLGCGVVKVTSAPRAVPKGACMLLCCSNNALSSARYFIVAVALQQQHAQ